MAGASQLGIYNKALRYLEERKLSSLTENREPRRCLDDEFSDAIIFCLYGGYWNFAIRQDKIFNDTNQKPIFGFEFCFTIPPDYIRNYQVADNEDFNPLIRRMDVNNNVMFTDISPIYMKYVSSDPNYGLNMSLWTPGFVEYLACYLAWLIAPRIKQDANFVDRLEKLLKKTKAMALSTDAMDLPPQETNVGTWVQSRAPRGSIVPGWGFGGFDG
jgi:hypothetical protein